MIKTALLNKQVFIVNHFILRQKMLIFAALFLHQNLAKRCKNVKKQIFIIFWSVHHPNSGQNLQHLPTLKDFKY